MPVRLLFATGVAVLLLLAFLPACEDTGLTAPANSTIILTAVPAAVLIDQDGGETEGSTQIYALVLDKGGQPLEGIPVVFTATGGRLDSQNFCSDLKCTRTNVTCASDDGCAAPETPAINTNPSGVAVDRLTMRLFGDPATSDVTAQISVISQKVTVTKQVNLGPADPVAVVVATPPTGQRTGSPFKFDGSTSTFDPQVELTCYEWTIDSNTDWSAAECVGVCDGKTQVIRGAEQAVVTLTVDEDLVDLTATLRVSDVPVTDPECSNLVDKDFSKPKSLEYEIRCDLTDPIVDAGPNQTALKGTPITLTATASDPESTTLIYQWDCGNAGGGGNTQSVVCTYPSVGIYTAKVIVTNECGRASQDGLSVTINAP